MNALVKQLPPPPANKQGWPWTVEHEEAFASPPAERPDWPKISIITPSFNQVKFIEATIRSVLLQGYPNVEYIIIDGGSTDGSVEIIKKYAAWLTYWTSEPDDGQSQAINKGFRQATGTIMAYINSDDIYYPNVFRKVVELFEQSRADILIGGTMQVVIDPDNHREEAVRRLIPSQGQTIHRFPIFANRRVEDFQFIQPSMFWQRKIWERTGSIDESYHYSMDRQWCLRALARGAQVHTTDEIYARFALHPGSKTNDFQPRFLLEAIRMYAEFSRQPQFRPLPCRLESLYYRLRLLQDTLYLKSDHYHQTRAVLPQLFFQTSAGIIRRCRIALNHLSVLQRRRTSHP